MWRVSLCASVAVPVALVLLHAKLPAAAQAPQPAWMAPDLLRAAKAEGVLTVYGSMNEQEALPLWMTFQDATGVKVS